MRRVFVGILLAVLAFFIPFSIIRADELDDINNQLSQLKKELSDKEANFNDLNNQLDGIKGRVAQIEVEVDEGEKDLSRMILIINERMRRHYININKNAASFVYLLVSDNFARAFSNFFYQGVIVDQDKTEIVRTARYIKDLKDKKAWLAQVQVEIDSQSKILAGEITTTRQKIASLSERQQSLVAAKQASLNIPRSAGTSARGCSDDRGVNPGFSPRLAFFTYGAPHRNGLNQYGAFGRAKAGQNDETILQAYYPSMSLTKDYDRNFQINVDGHGTFSIEDYMKHIFEVPDSWGNEGGMAALRAQAVAARTYAINSQQRNGHICTTEACQVFHAEEKGGNWAQAVSDTAGWVLLDGGNPGFTQYASTHGGYIRNLSKFDGDGGNPGNFGDLNSRAWDKESPWFYCDWGARSQYSNTAWLQSSEVADIVNVILLARRDSGTGEHLYQTDKPHPYGGEIWNEERVKSELRSRGGSPFNSISDVSVSVDFGGGTTNGITLSGDAGSQSFSGDEFKGWFNLRAPANIQVVGPLFNVERQ